MNTIKCRIKVNDTCDVPGVGVTPAQVVVLRTIHDREAGGCCIKNAVPSGTVERSTEAELQRLRSLYRVPARSGARGSNICDDLFGGPGTVPNLPQRFDELPEKFKIKVQQIESAVPPLDPEAEAPPQPKRKKGKLEPAESAE